MGAFSDLFYRRSPPFRYRGYVYDEETQLYYLRSRYYNPVWGRFVNADVLLSTGQGLLSCNVYAYCLNRPVVMYDPNGLSGILQIFAHKNHAWLVFTSDTTNITKTIGTWGNKSHVGVNYNIEVKFLNDGGYKGRVSLSAHIDDKQEESLNQFIDKNDRWDNFYNCASFAADAWEATGLGTLKHLALGFVPTPGALARSIKKIDGHQVDAPIVLATTNGQEKQSSSNPISSSFDSLNLSGLSSGDSGSCSNDSAESSFASNWF